jgi:hypothetical protein
MNALRRVVIDARDKRTYSRHLVLTKIAFRKRILGKLNRNMNLPQLKAHDYAPAISL